MSEKINLIKDTDETSVRYRQSIRIVLSKSFNTLSENELFVVENPKAVWAIVDRGPRTGGTSITKRIIHLRKEKLMIVTSPYNQRSNVLYAVKSW